MKRRAIPYSDAEMTWLEAHRTMVISDYHAAFQAEFGRAEVSAAHLHGLRKRKGWKVGRAKGRTAGRHWRYSPTEMAWLRANHSLPIAEYHRAFANEFERPEITAANLHGLRKRMGWKTGRTGFFEKGQEPANKGKSMPFNANSAATRFKKGQQPANTKFLGHERIRTDGYVEISIAETNPYTGFERRYVLKHLHLWEAANGRVPEGHCLKCLDGDKTNTDPANWTAIPRGVLPRLNGGRATRVMAYDTAPPDLKPTVLALARLEHRANDVRRRQRAAS